MRPRTRTVAPVVPARTGRQDGLAYALWLAPGGDLPAAGLVILHGAGSCQESHYDFARAGIALGIAVLTFDQRGHGQSQGPMDARAVADVVSMARFLRHELAAPAMPLALRGSSMGGLLAILAAADAGAGAVVAICPASAAGLRRGLSAGSLRFDADAPALGELLDSIDLGAAVEALDAPLLLLHAAGDEQVPIQHSRELAAVVRSPASRLIEVPGGHHRSIQHDEELQAVSLRFVQHALGLR